MGTIRIRIQVTSVRMNWQRGTDGDGQAEFIALQKASEWVQLQWEGFFVLCYCYLCDIYLAYLDAPIYYLSVC